MFEFDTEKAQEYMNRGALMDHEDGLVTAFAVICIGSHEGDASHGGQLTLSGEEAVAAAQQANAQVAEGLGAGCRYLPTLVSIHPAQLLQLVAMSRGGAN